MRISLRFLIVLSCVFLIYSRAGFLFAEGSSSHKSGKSSSSKDDYYGEEEDKPKRKKRFKGYSKQGKKFTTLCEQIESDGRIQFFYDLMKINDVKDLKCIACKPLFKAFSRGCKLKKKRIKRGEPTPTLIKKQREPNAGVLSSAADLFSEIFSLEEMRDDSLKAVEKLVEVLLDKEEKSKAESDYCGILAEYIYAPFAAYAVRQKKKERRLLSESQAWIPSEEEDEAKLDALFDF